MRRIALAIAALLAAASAYGQPKPEAVLRKEAGNGYLKQRQYAKARDEYLAALKIDPTYEDAHYNLGVVYFFRLQDYPRALYHLTAYARAAADAPDIAQVKSLVSQALEKIEEPEREAYGKALTEGTADSLRAFVEKYPASSYLSDAKTKLRLLEAYEEGSRQQANAVAAAYAAASAKGTSEALDAFLAANPDAPQAAEARRRRDQLADDEKAWKSALEAGTPAALERFVAERPLSPLAAQARAKLDELKAEADRKTQQETAARAAADDAWAAAERTGTADAFDLFARSYPDHPRAVDARARAQELRAAATQAPAAAPVPAAPAETEPATPAETAPAAAAPAPGPAVPAAATEAPRSIIPPEAPPPPMDASPPPAAPSVPPQAPPPTSLAGTDADLAAAWKQAQTVDSVEAYRTFLEKYPQGEESEAARKRMQELFSPLPGGSRTRSLERYRKMIQGK